ncbi:MAG TPA: RIO1 family regulatory kinase/ATPase, partial [Archangium sp.]
MEKLQQLLDEGVIEEVFNQLKTGKEAEVWLVSHHGEPVAAKIYKAREFRSFKNDAGYKEGRQVRNTRTQRAMDKGSKFGRESSEEAWKSMESDTMFSLHAAGVRCPKPVMFYDGVLLMEVIGDAEGRVAPRLVEAVISREQAESLYVTLRQEVIKMLAEDVIHGDLSEFNILLGANGPVIIDFPQVITAAKNSQSEKYFRRDLGNLIRFFSGADPSLEGRHAGDADEIWREYVRRDLSANFVPSGRKFQGGPRQGGDFRRGGPQRQRNGGPQQNGGPRGQRNDGPQQNAGAQRGPRNDRAQQAPRNDASQENAGAQQGQRNDRVQQNASAPQGQRNDRPPRSDGGRQGQRNSGPQQNGGQRGQRHDGAQQNTGGQRGHGNDGAQIVG